MAVLDPSEYDEYYFDGATRAYSHNAGYTWYHKYNYPQKGYFAQHGVPIEESTGTMYGDLCKALNIKLNARFVGKTCLILGSAYGYEVQGFRELGIDAYGVDVSQFAYDQADINVQPYLTVADARTYVPSLGRNSFDYIFSQGFLECMSDTDLTDLIPELNRVCRSEQVHIVHTNGNINYYNIKTLEEWSALDFDNGTILVNNWDFDNYVTV